MFFELTHDPFSNLTPAVNARGEVAWKSGSVSDTDIMFLRRFDLGDLNCDGVIDGFDIDGFLLALFDPDEFSNQHPACDAALADINQDGSIDALDIEPFIELLFP